VKAGDTLSAIARTYGTTVAAIAQANGISNTSKINAGQKLTIPGVTGPVASGSVRYYTVQPGDNLSRIAAKYGVTVDSIVKANKIANPRLIYSGTKLIIP
jgi:LysM repeat protein